MIWPLRYSLLYLLLMGTKGKSVQMSQQLKGVGTIFLHRVFTSDLYREGPALGQGLSLYKVKLSPALSWRHSLHGLYTCLAILAFPDSSPVLIRGLPLFHMFF